MVVVRVVVVLEGLENGGHHLEKTEEREEIHCRRAEAREDSDCSSKTAAPNVGLATIGPMLTLELLQPLSTAWYAHGLRTTLNQSVFVEQDIGMPPSAGAKDPPSKKSAAGHKKAKPRSCCVQLK